jgi:hypothetical protein
MKERNRESLASFEARSQEEITRPRRRRERGGPHLPGWFLAIILLLAIAAVAGLWWKAFIPERPEVTLTPSPSPTPTPTRTPTPLPPPTPTPTPPAEITVGGYVKVTGTGIKGLRLRSGPGLDYITFKILEEGSILKVLGGPEEADGYTWWRLEDEAGVIGWSVEDWLEPTSH